MPNVYNAESLGIKPPAGGFQQGGWYNGRQYWGGTFSDPGVIHPSSNQQGAGQLVSREVNAQSAVAQGKTPQQLEDYLESQRRKSASVIPTGVLSPSAGGSAGLPGGVPGAGGSGVPGMATPTTLDLNRIYDENYQASGIKALEEELAAKARQYTEARGANNDNPFLSEATRVGREAKLEKLYGERTANVQNEIAMKKADIDTRLNLSLKQFDINSQAAQQALSQFNTLLSLGALDNASGEDIAAITRSTGISSNMILNAIKTSKSSKEKADTQVITSTNDAGVVTASVIDKQTGQIISQQNLGKIGNAERSGGGQPKATDAEVRRYYLDNLRQDISNYRGVKDIFNLYAGYIDPNEILQIYNATSPYGAAKESQEELAALGVKF